MRRAAHSRTRRFLQIPLASVAIAIAAIAAADVKAQIGDVTNDAPTPLAAMFMACVAPDVPMALRAKAVQDAGWQAATRSPQTTGKLAEQLAVRADRGDPPQSWATVLSEARMQASAPDPEMRLFVIDGDVPSLLAIRHDPATGSVSCGYSASDSSREALQLLLGVGKGPSEQSGGTLTIRAAVTVRAVVKDKLSRGWQVEASSHFADPTEITTDTGQSFSTAFALSIALTPAEN